MASKSAHLSNGQQRNGHANGSSSLRPESPVSGDEFEEGSDDAPQASLGTRVHADDRVKRKASPGGGGGGGSGLSICFPNRPKDRRRARLFWPMAWLPATGTESRSCRLPMLRPTAW